MTPQDVNKILAILKARYGDKLKVNDATVDAWSMVLDDVQYHDVLAVLPEWMKEQEWPPDPAQIRNSVIDRLPSALPSVDEAWQIVQARIAATYPGHHMPEWKALDEIQDAVKDIGGLRAIRMSEKPADMEKRFRAAYGERRQREGRLTVLPGGMKEVPA